jgi:hypothetical protein
MTDSNHKTGIERRLYRRVGLVTEVRCEHEGKEEILLTRDISEGGIFVASDKPFPLGTEVKILLHLSAAGPGLGLTGLVVYIVPDLGMGIEFANLSGEARNVLREFVALSPEGST